MKKNKFVKLTDENIYETVLSRGGMAYVFKDYLINQLGGMETYFCPDYRVTAADPGFPFAVSSEYFKYAYNTEIVDKL